MMFVLIGLVLVVFQRMRLVETSALHIPRTQKKLLVEFMRGQVVMLTVATVAEDEETSRRYWGLGFPIPISPTSLITAL
jgi:hypothetical protein